MDDLSVFRRFFVISDIIRELLATISPMMAGAVPAMTNTAASTSSTGETPVDMSQTVGGGLPPIRGARPAASPRSRRRRAAPQLPNTARYSFPKPVD